MSIKDCTISRLSQVLLPIYRHPLPSLCSDLTCYFLPNHTLFTGMHTAQRTLFTAHFLLHTAYWTLRHIQCTLAQCTLHTSTCTLAHCINWTTPYHCIASGLHYTVFICHNLQQKSCACLAGQMQLYYTALHLDVNLHYKLHFTVSLFFIFVFAFAFVCIFLFLCMYIYICFCICVCNFIYICIIVCICICYCICIWSEVHQSLCTAPLMRCTRMHFTVFCICICICICLCISICSEVHQSLCTALLMRCTGAAALPPEVVLITLHVSDNLNLNHHIIILLPSYHLDFMSWYPFQQKVFSYASSSTLHPRQRVTSSFEACELVVWQPCQWR